MLSEEREITEINKETADEAAQESEALAEVEEAGPAPDALEERLAEAEAQAASYLESWQRERADFLNYKKRVERELTEIHLNGRLEMASRFLPVLDDFARALDSAPDDMRESDWFSGLGLIYRKLQGVLEAEGIVEIEALGQPFDPNFHEAVSHDEDDDCASDHVIEVLQRGYRHGDRVLRPAMVRVAR